MGAPLGTVPVLGTRFAVRLIEERGANDMVQQRLWVSVFVGAVLATGSWGQATLQAGEVRTCAAAEDPKQNPDEGKSGTVVGIVTAKGENFIEVKAAGEERGRRYVPRWIGGLPKDGGGLDKDMLKVFRELKVGSRVRVEWKFEERARALKVEVLKAAPPK
ncbi:MAG: hypothetical protein L0Z62_36695 [Gemmataceae bacterium]|nr:hypothetical protein [Gemmataceae bacterium]